MISAFDLPLTKAGLLSRRRKLRCVKVLGKYRDREGNIQNDPRCKNSACRWLNKDGTVGCTDINLLEFNHKEGGGHRREGTRSRWRSNVLRDYQTTLALSTPCANCHRMKTAKEQGGARLHKSARVE